MVHINDSLISDSLAKQFFSAVLLCNVDDRRHKVKQNYIPVLKVREVVGEVGNLLFLDEE